MGRDLADDGAVKPVVKQQRDNQRKYLRNGIAPPNQIVVAGLLPQPGQHIGHGNEENELTDKGDDHGVGGVAQRLERTAQSDAGACHAEAQRNDPQGGGAHGKHGVGSVEKTQQRGGDGEEDGRTHHHDAGGIEGVELDGGGHALTVLGAVVESHNGNDAVVHAEDGHKDEAIELEVDAEHSGGSLGGRVIGDEDLVHQKDHHGANGHHNDRGDADGVNAADDLPVGTETAEVQLDVGVFPPVEDETEDAAANLPDHGGNGGAADAQTKHKDENGVKDDVDDSAQALRVHGVEGTAGALKEPLEHHLAEKAERTAAGDEQIVTTLLHDIGNACLSGKKRTGKEYGQNGTDNKTHKGQKDAVAGHRVGALGLFGAQRPSHQRVDAHRRAGGQSDHQLLGGEG